MKTGFPGYAFSFCIAQFSHIAAEACCPASPLAARVPSRVLSTEFATAPLFFLTLCTAIFGGDLSLLYPLPPWPPTPAISAVLIPGTYLKCSLYLSLPSVKALCIPSCPDFSTFMPCCFPDTVPAYLHLFKLLPIIHPSPRPAQQLGSIFFLHEPNCAFPNL